ncbi:hypothetical protein [Bacillus subtilis]|nr:hypothetical protein [Bacillus subtilis]
MKKIILFTLLTASIFGLSFTSKSDDLNVKTSVATLKTIQVAELPVGT